MDPHVYSDPHISKNEQRVPPVLFHSDVITPTKPNSRGLLADIVGYSSPLDVHAQAPGSIGGDSLRLPSNVTSETPSAKAHAPVVLQNPIYLPTPQSPGNMASYLLTRTPVSAPNFHPDLESFALPTEFRSQASSSPPPLRSHSIPTPEHSPLVPRTRNSSHLLSQRARTNSHDGIDGAGPDRRDGSRSHASTPPRTPSRQMSTRPVTPVLQCPPQRRPTENSSPASSRLDDPSSPLERVKDEPGGETFPIHAQSVENAASIQAAEFHRPDCSKRVRRLAPSSSSIGAGGPSLASDLGGQDESLLWSSANVESTVKGKRIALFQETSEESFEESLMAGGYGPYRSDRPWKLDEDAEMPKQLGDAAGEEDPGSALVLTEEEKRRKTRLAAFLDPPRPTSSPSQLFPVEIEGRGRVLMKVEASEPHTPPKPTPKTKRSRKRKKTLADMKHDVDKDSTAAPEEGAIDGPNWPDTEFPWRSRPVAQDGLSSCEREERLRYIESFLDRDSDEDGVEEGCSPSSQRSFDEAPSRSPRPGGGKTYPLLSYSKGRRCGTTTLSVVPSDPADARTALLSKKSIRAVRLRLLRRRDTDRGADGDDGEVLCICRGRDDGRPLVQCDACRTWYHMECIGILSMSELGREEDPWFCANCAEVKTPPPVMPTLVPADDDEHDVEGYDPPFLNIGLNPSPAMPWTRSVGPPMTPPRTRYAPHNAPGPSWDEPPSSSSRGDPRTPPFNTASAFGDMVRVYGMTPGRSLEASSSTIMDGSPFDPTSTPSRGIRFGLPFTTPKDGKWGSSLWQGIRGGSHDLFHTPKHPGEDGGAASSKYGQPLLYHGRVGEDSEGPSGVPGSHRTTGPSNVTPVERDVLSGLKRMQVLESPLGAKRSRRMAVDDTRRS